MGKEAREFIVCYESAKIFCSAYPGLRWDVPESREEYEEKPIVMRDYWGKERDGN